MQLHGQLGHWMILVRMHPLRRYSHMSSIHQWNWAHHLIVPRDEWRYESVQCQSLENWYNHFNFDMRIYTLHCTLSLLSDSGICWANLTGLAFPWSSTSGFQARFTRWSRSRFAP
jgi:hypothetical protein